MSGIYSLLAEFEERQLTIQKVGILPLPLMAWIPLGCMVNRSAMRARVASDVCILPGSPWDSMRAAVLTASPHKSYTNFLLPITPATTGPECMPILSDILVPSIGASVST